MSTVLVVEDDQDVSAAIADSLEDAGYGVSIAPNGAVAIRKLKASPALPSVILLDLMMPVMDGEHFLQEMRKDPELSAVPVVLLTADGSANRKAASLGAHGWLRKPFHLEELIRTVSKYCQEQ